MQTIPEMIDLISRYFTMHGNTNSLNYPQFNKKHKFNKNINLIKHKFNINLLLFLSQCISSLIENYNNFSL